MAALLCVTHLVVIALPFLRQFNLYTSLPFAALYGLIGIELGMSQSRRRSVYLAAISGGRRGLRMLLFSAALLCLGALWEGWCEPTLALGSYLLLALPSLLLGLGLGLALRSEDRALRWRVLWALLIVISFGLAAGLQFMTRPGIAIYSHLLGYWPGSIYDRLRNLETSLIAFRLSTLGWSLLLIALVDGAERFKQGGPLRLLGASLCGLIFGGTDLWAGAHFRYRVTHEVLQEHLSVVRQHDELSIWMPAHTDAALADAILADHLLYLREFTALKPEVQREPLRSYVFANASDKAAYLGASRTSFVKPWLRQIVIDSPTAYHPVVGHEMVHAVSADWVASPLSIPWRGLLPNMFVVEGLASALAPASAANPHEVAARWIAKGNFPGVQALMKPTEFWKHPSRRVYAVAESWFRFLAQQDDATKVPAYYVSQNADAIFGKSHAQLEKEWLAQLPEIEKATAPAAVKSVLKQQSIFEAQCPSVVEKLRAKISATPPGQRAELLERLCTYTPTRFGCPGAIIDDQLYALAKAHSPDPQALKACAARLGELDDDPNANDFRRRLKIHFLSNNQGGWSETLEAAKTFSASDAPESRLWWALENLATSPAAKGVISFLLGFGDRDKAMLDLQDMLSTPTTSSVQRSAAAYVLARQLLPHPTRAKALLLNLDSESWPSSVRRERWRLLTRLAFETKDPILGVCATRRWEDLSTSLSDLDRVRWWRRRLSSLDEAKSAISLSALDCPD